MIDFYTADVSVLADPDLFSSRLDRLPPCLSERREKIRQIKSEAAARSSLGAGILLALALNRAGVPDDAVLTVGPCGKPELEGQGSVYFNLSHSGDRAVCAVSDRPIGVDVERIATGHLQVARRFFCPSEYDIVAYGTASDTHTAESAQANRFYRLWTLKESYVKAFGQGFAIPMNSFCVGIDRNDRAYLVRGHGEEPPTPVEFHELGLCDGYRYACALLGPGGYETLNHIETDLTNPGSV